LIEWLRDAPAPRRLLINHGEPTSADALRRRIRDELGWEAEAAREGMAYEA
jgi:metallo-beta-lactamase family protein